MYYPNQVVYSLSTNQPVKIGSDVWNKNSYPKGKTIPFVDKSGKVMCPKSVEEALVLLQSENIKPQPIAKNQCPSCLNWFAGAPYKECEHKENHYKCAGCNKYWDNYDVRDGKRLCAVCCRNR